MIISKSFLAGRKFPLALLSGLLVLAGRLGARETPKPASPDYWVYIGTYTGALSKGIYVCRMNPDTGRLSEPVLAAETPGPGFLDADVAGRFLYAVNSVNTFEGKPAGAITSFAIDPASGRLTELNRRSTVGTGPCHVVLDRTGHCVLVSNYGNGSETVLPVLPDGSLGEASDYIQFEGRGVNPQRQEKPHAHGTFLDAANRFAFVCDLGTDKIMSYHLDAARGTLTPGDPPWFSVKPGAGPRHLAIHPNGRFAYVINEIQSTITALRLDDRKGSFREIQTVPSLPDRFTNANTAAEIAIHPSGKFLYASNRGLDSIAVFKLDPRDGQLTPVQQESTQGKTPRFFTLDPTGHYLIAANQDSDSVVVFRIDPQTGKLEPTGRELKVGSPVCIKFVNRL